MVRQMRSCRPAQPVRPSTGTRFAASALRMRLRVTKKKLVKRRIIGPTAQLGMRETPQRWKRYQKIPVTWYRPRIRRARPTSGACGEGAAPEVVRLRCPTVTRTPAPTQAAVPPGARFVSSTLRTGRGNGPPAQGVTPSSGSASRNPGALPKTAPAAASTPAARRPPPSSPVTRLGRHHRRQRRARPGRAQRERFQPVAGGGARRARRRPGRRRPCPAGPVQRPPQSAAEPLVPGAPVVAGRAGVERRAASGHGRDRRGAPGRHALDRLSTPRRSPRR